VHWFGFHTDHDFAYLYRVLKGADLPMQENQFLDDVVNYFPNIYDVKIMADYHLKGFRSSLQQLAQILGVTRDDNCEHQAGSDSKITAKCFFELKQREPALVSMTHGDILGFNRMQSDNPFHGLPS
jgi:CCR4-NOT transcription complex subunit 7/8